MKPVKVFIISQEEPFYLPKTIKHILNHQNEDFNVVGGTILPPYRKNKTIIEWVKERIIFYTLFEICIAAFMVFYCKIHTKLFNNSPYAVKNVYEEYKISTIFTNDINEKIFLKKLKTLEIDIILSISPPQIFKDELLSIPNKFCLNAHGTLLPRHRGVFGSWWTLFENDHEAGSTIHTMDQKLDRGKILFQQEFKVQPNETQYSLAFKTKKLLAEGAIILLKQIKQNLHQTIPVKYQESYHRAPTKTQGKYFHKKGISVITLKDIKLIVKKAF